VTDRQRVMALLVRHSYLVSNYTYKTRNKQRKRADRRASHAQSLSTRAARRRSKRRHLGLVSVTLTARYTRAARPVARQHGQSTRVSFWTPVYTGRVHGPCRQKALSCNAVSPTRCVTHYPCSRRRHGPCSRVIKRCLCRP